MTIDEEKALARMNAAAYTYNDDVYLKAGLQLFNSINVNDTRTLATLLTKDGIEYELTELRDSQGFTPLSLAAFKNAE